MRATGITKTRVMSNLELYGFELISDLQITF